MLRISTNKHMLTHGFTWSKTINLDQNFSGVTSIKVTTSVRESLQNAKKKSFFFIFLLQPHMSFSYS